MQKKVIQILANHSILSDAVGDMIFKALTLAFAIDIDKLKLSKNEAEKISKICEEEIKNKCNLQKVTIILTTNKAVAKPQTKVVENKKNLLGEEISPVFGVKKIIAIASAKGGVGKSTMAANLAISLQKIGYKIALVDSDIYGPSIPHLMGLTTKPVNKDGSIIPLIAHKIKCISVGSLIDENSAGVWRGPMITKILYQLIRSVNWACDGNDVDFMIVDMPPGTGDVYLSLAEKFPLAGVVIVSTPQSLAIIDVVRSIDCFNKLHIPIIGIIQNMSYLKNGSEKQYLFGQDGAKNLAKKMQINFLGEVPIEQEISSASEDRVPLVVANAHSEVALLIGQIAEEIIDKI